MIGTYVTSWARIEMYKAIKACYNENIAIMYMDTDGLILRHNKDQKLPLLQDPSLFGAYKNEILGTIEQYISLGPKNYTIRSKHDGMTSVLIKLRGFYLSSQSSEDYGSPEITENTYKQFLMALLKEDKKMCQLVPQFQIKFHKKNSSLYSKYNLKRFANYSFNKRILIKDENNYFIYSLPFGFTEEVYQKCKEISKDVIL